MVAENLKVWYILEVDRVVQDAVMQGLALQLGGRVIPFLFTQGARVIRYRLPFALRVLLL
jgi:hypothetical protein